MRKIFFFIILILLCGCSGVKEVERVEAKEGVQGEGIGIKRGEVAKMLALCYFDISEIESMDRIIVFQDTTPEYWYDKYINAVVTKQVMSGADSELFKPNEYLSLEHAQMLASRLDSTIKLSFEHEERKKPVAYSLWCQIMEKILEKNSSVVKKEFVILADCSNSEYLPMRYAVSDIGLISIEGVNEIAGDSLNCRVTGYLRGGEVLFINNIIDLTPTLDNALVCEEKSSGAYLKIGGCQKFFYYDNDEIRLTKDEIVNVQINGNTIISK